MSLAAADITSDSGKSLFSQLYDYAMKNDICNKDYSEFVDIAKFKDKNPDKRSRNKFSKAEVKRLWELAEDPYYQIVLMLIYNGYRNRIDERRCLRRHHLLRTLRDAVFPISKLVKPVQKDRCGFWELLRAEN